LLVFLIKHPRRIVSPRTLLATRWGGDHIRQTEFLPLLLGLRKKLETAGLPSHYLRTESWVFYRFETTRETSAAHDVMANKTA
jgi:DNA-binding response OmpR family regulator